MNRLRLPDLVLTALATPGPRIVVLGVGGVIDLGRRELRFTEPFLTIAGRTDPHGASRRSRADW